MIQGDMNYCVAAEYKKVDKKLNQIYQEILKHISDKREQVNLLKKSPNLWIKYRDADCEFRSFGVYGGSVYPMILLMCLTSYRKNRRAYKKEFEAMLKCEEGNLSCPFIIKTQNLGFFVDISS
ncbi:MAG: lysozyme inhibitor LprI family protein [Rickettsia africae]|uniref:Lysozyme inhibitor LprI-like N-terminal domain-containing protein n=1 Tax=Rickettsia africae (strain ESF-5) TaxID=347255 RepID=C3PM79_RICAE|nr:lysozyme inhibitor LprI family protein [Rickettsia africae]ACP53039.1 Unknown [Rickettsia africae ESF-5]